MTRNNEGNSLLPLNKLRRAGEKVVAGLVAAAALSGCATEAKQNNAPASTGDSYSAPADPSVENQPPAVETPADAPTASANQQETNQQPHLKNEKIPLDELPSPETINEASVRAVVALSWTLSESMWAKGEPANQANGTLNSQEPGEAYPIDMPFGSVTAKGDEYGNSVIHANILRIYGDGDFVKLAVGVDVNSFDALQDPDYPGKGTGTSGGFTERSIGAFLGRFELNTTMQSIEILRGNINNPNGAKGEIYDKTRIGGLSDGEKKELINRMMATLEEITDGYYGVYDKVRAGGTPAATYMSEGAAEAGVK